MRPICAFVLATFLWTLTLALGGDAAFAIFQCGMVNGSFSCSATTGGEMHGKNAGPVTESTQPPSESAPIGATSPAAPTYGAPAQGAVNYGASTPPQGSSMPEPAKPGEHACPPGYTVLARPGKYGYCQPPARGMAEAATAATPGGCQHGMVGSPPNCRCPKNSELLGGNCVHYTATMCQSELPVNVSPEPCQDVEAKLSCKMRQDGLKDCCCLTYDKL
jgi:hypothetical protein